MSLIQGLNGWIKEVSRRARQPEATHANAWRRKVCWRVKWEHEQVLAA
jgi:hypothetical protein